MMASELETLKAAFRELMADLPRQLNEADIWIKDENGTYVASAERIAPVFSRMSEAIEKLRTA